jgi:hypothetical protein
MELSEPFVGDCRPDIRGNVVQPEPGIDRQSFGTPKTAEVRRKSEQTGRKHG